MFLITGLRLSVASIRFAIIFQGPFTSLRFSKKANRLVSGSDDGMIAIWRTKDWVCVSFKPAHKGSVTDLDVNPSGKVMISCGRDNNVRLWDMTSSKELYSRSARKSSTHARQRAAATTGFEAAVASSGEGFCYALVNDVSICNTKGDECAFRICAFSFFYVYLSGK